MSKNLKAKTSKYLYGILKIYNSFIKKIKTTLFSNFRIKLMFYSHNPSRNLTRYLTHLDWIR